MSKFDVQTHRGSAPFDLRYLAAVPKGADEDQKFPLLLFLHGAGERGDDLSVLTKHGPPAMIAQGDSFEMIVVAPQCPAKSWWNPKQLVSLIDGLVAKYPVDTDRIYVTGLSMGGYATWGLLAEIPDRIAAAVPICGGGDPEQADRMTGVPIWAFHGDADNVVPVSQTERMIDAIRQASGQPKVTIYPGVKHDSWTETYENPDVFEWMRKQRLSNRNKTE